MSAIEFIGKCPQREGWGEKQTLVSLLPLPQNGDGTDESVMSGHSQLVSDWRSCSFEREDLRENCSANLRFLAPHIHRPSNKVNCVLQNGELESVMSALY